MSRHFTARFDCTCCTLNRHKYFDWARWLYIANDSMLLMLLMLLILFLIIFLRFEKGGNMYDDNYLYSCTLYIQLYNQRNQLLPASVFDIFLFLNVYWLEQSTHWRETHALNCRAAIDGVVMNWGLHKSHPFTRHMLSKYEFEGRP